MIQHAPTLDRSSLRTALLDAGIARGDALIVHSSMKSMGHVAGGPEAVIAALQDVLGAPGTLLMPTFSLPQPDGVFHVTQTPSRTGLLTEVFRQSADVVRSWHPTHSVTAWGAHAADWTVGHERLGGLGVGSPLHQAAEAGAKVLMIGCDLRRCSLVHVAEAIVRVPYLGKIFYTASGRTLEVATPDGRTVVVPPIDPPGCSAAFGAVQAPLEAAGGLRRITLGEATCLLCNGHAILSAAVGLLRRSPDALLCTGSGCTVCPRARALLAEQSTSVR